MRAPTTRTLALIAAAFALAATAGCSTTPVPTADELGSQSAQIMTQCGPRSNTDECKTMTDTFCNGLSRYVDSNNGKVSFTDFGDHAMTMKMVAVGCPGITFS